MINKVKLLSIMLFLAGFIVLSCDNSCCAEEAPEPENKVTLSGIDVASKPTKELYVAGEKFDSSGMVVNATYSDNSTKELKDGEYTYSPTGTLTENNTNITISYTDGGITRETEISITIGYTVTVGEFSNGSVTSNVGIAKEKSVVKLTAKPVDDRYILKSLWYEYTENSGSVRTMNLDVKEGKTEYAFDMPSYNVIVKAEFELAGDVETYSFKLNKKGEKNKASVRFVYNEFDSADEEKIYEKILPGTEIEVIVTMLEKDYFVPEIPVLVYDDERIPLDVVDPDTGNFKFTMPDKNITVEITIAKIGSYKFSASIVGGKGSVDLKVNNETINHETYLKVGDEIVATITPADDFELSYAQFNEEKIHFDDLDENNQCTFIMEDKASSLEVVFTEKEGFEVVQGVVENGTLQISHTLAKEGTTVMITATPDDGYADVDVITVKTAGGTEITVNKSETGKYNFVMPEEAVTVGCVFRGYKITINSNEYGTVDAVKTAKSGEEITLTANATEKNALGTISVKAGEDYLKNTRTDIESGKAEITFTMPASDVEIDATFGKAITVTAGFTPENSGMIELYQGKTYITLGNTMYFAPGTELTLETIPGTIGDGIYEVGDVKTLAANDIEKDLGLDTTVTPNEEYKITVGERNFNISVEFKLSNANRVFINKENLVGGTVVVEESGKIVTSSSDSWLSGDAYIINGHTITVKATADVGYAVGTITCNEKTITNGGTYTMSTEPVEIKATFKKDSYPLNFNSSVANGSFTLSSDFTYDATTQKLSPAGTIYISGDKVPYGDVVYIIATPLNTVDTTYMEQITVMNDTEGQAVKLERYDSVSKPYQFEMPASASGVTVSIHFEFASSDVNLYVNGSPVTSFYLNPTPDKATWGTLTKEYRIRYQNEEGYWCEGWPLKQGDKVQIKDKAGTVLNSYEGALGFDETNLNYDMKTATYTVEGDGVYKMYYKLWGDGTYSIWIEIPKTGALTNADYFLTVNGQKVEKMSVSASLDPAYPTLIKQFYSKNIDLQVGDKVGIETNAASVPSNGILHWEDGWNSKEGIDYNPLIDKTHDGKVFEIPAAGEYDFYFKIWADGGTSIWIEKSKPVVTP